MVYGGKPSTGCFLCRKRKIKCDEAVPQCRNCLVYGRPCPGYRKDTIFRNETQKVEQLMRKNSIVLADNGRRSRSTSTSGDSHDSSLSLYRVADSTWDERAVCYFFDQFTTLEDHEVCINHLGFLPSLYATCRDTGYDGSVSSCLRQAVDATALIALGNEVKAPNLIVKARDYYGLAIRGLRQALASKTLAVKDETFATMILLCLFEDIAGERNGLASSHTAGLEFLVKLRGANQLGNAQGRELFSFAYAHNHIEILALREKPRYRTDWIVDQLDCSDPVIGLMVVASKLSRLFLEASSYQGPFGLVEIEKLVSWIDAGRLMDLELAQWAQHLPNNWLPLDVYSPTGESLLTYQRIAVATIWKYYRAVRIILQRLMLELRQTLASVVDDRQTYEEIFQGDANVTDVIQDMITDTCRSIPYCFGDVDMSGNPPSSSINDKPRIRAIYGYIMLWPLWYTYSCGLATEAQTEQLRSALARVGSALGIRLALVLARDNGPQHTSPGENPFRNPMGDFAFPLQASSMQL
ncbi:Zn(II)2Cys6 transcription factor [Aspergillus steynii IBT 23096]|uniref:Zn(II)2Cys6 transcription factor n=1 Tax=Aspergillus steynii IBT 23096 TaxID=1392250 RepID=A0A2I2G4R5_9EURO|nr:Zn(II)2Cys6 transcription factor [Aspergillus steynii IBT 23096]PLB47870.1 Zn(II)2Cys6 transcription factor [Aspergillus steynii IBT 23096]